jgi:hypothetical protein
MKNKFLFSIILLTISLWGCENTRYITEAYIKNNIEKHIEGNQSSIKTYSIYQIISKTNKKSGAYIEFTGCKYEGTKILIVGADVNYLARDNWKLNVVSIAEPTFVVLTMKQTIAILSNYNDLKEKITAEHPIISEEAYHDYAVADDLFISFRKAIGSGGTSEIDVWVKGEKYTIKTDMFIKKLKKFIDY